MMNSLELNDEIQNQLDNKMQEGYRLSMLGNSIAASNIWSELWGKIKETMRQYNINYIADFDKIFHGKECIYNWAPDFELELDNSSSEDEGFVLTRLDFCIEYVVKSNDKNEHNVFGFKRTIAELYFTFGRIEAGEKLFTDYVK